MDMLMLYCFTPDGHLRTTRSMVGWNQLPYTSNNDILSEQKPAARIGMGFGVDFLPFPDVAIWIVQFEVNGFLQYLEKEKKKSD